MARPRVVIGCAIALAASLTLVQPGHANPSTPAAPSDPSKSGAQLGPKLDLEGPEAEAKDHARQLFQQGVAAYRAGRYYEAVDIFLETQRIYPDTQLCFNIARAYENLGNASAALRYYRDYLRQADRPSDGDEVRARVRKLEQQLAERGVQQLTVLSQPEAATVVLDGKPVGITPWTGETYPGKHRLTVMLSAHTSQEQVVEVHSHTARDVALVLLPEPERKPLGPAVAATPVQKPRPLVTLETLVTLGTGLALLGSAMVSEVATKEPGMSSPTAFLAGGGMGLTGAGCVMLYFDLAPRAQAARSAPSRAKDSASAR